MRKELTFLFTISVLSWPIFAQANNWLRQIDRIKPLESNERDVERLLGKPSSRYSDFGEYTTKEGVFTMIYSHGRCDQIVTPHYNVEKGTVISFDFAPRTKILFSKLNIDVSKWETEITNDVSPPTVTYINTEKGVDYSVHDGILNYVQIYSSQIQSSLECKGSEKH